MEIDELRHYCLAKAATTEGLPFGPGVLVIKVANKMFATISLDEEQPRINLKCAPQRAIELREQYAEITPGYHMNKQHWNTVFTTGGLPASLVRELIDHSYERVVDSLTKKVREEHGLG